MQGFCTECGQGLDTRGQCPTGHSSLTPAKALAGDSPTSTLPTPEVTRPQTLAPTASYGIGRLPKARISRRLLGSGIEFLCYWGAILVLTFFSLVSAGFIGFFAVPLVFGIVFLRDMNSGTFSIAKRVGSMRVVDVQTGQPASNGQALSRNSYFLAMLALMMFPLIKVFFVMLFCLFTLIDVMMIVASPQGRRLGDLIAGTQVVPAVRS